jgi:hypothetical protein
VEINSQINIKKMKKQLLNIAAAIALFSLPNLSSAQVITLGAASDFVLFTTNGAVSNTGISQITGNVGTNVGASTNFGNVNGQMHDQDGTSGLCAANLLTAYNQLNAAIPTFFPAPLLGNGQTLNAGVYSVAGNASLNLILNLDAQGNPNAVFIIQISGALSTNAASQVILLNGAKACNVYWKVEGLVSMAAGTKMKGNVVANNAAIIMNSGSSLEGRALSTAGAVTVDGVLAYTPIGCGSPYLTGPTSPTLASVACYALFSSNGAATNTGNTFATGDVGTNVGLTTGYNPLNITGMIHPIPDGNTNACAADLLTVYNYLNLLPHDIELLYPAQFGNSLVLTPHTYVINGAVTFIDTLFLSGQGNPNAVFVIKVNGAFATGTYANVVLTNGTQAKNVYWNIDGALSINNFSKFKGTMIVNNGAVSLNKGMKITGRVLTTDGIFSTDSINVALPNVPIIASSNPNNLCGGTTATLTATGANSYTWNPGGTGSVIVVSPTVTTTYTLNGSNGACINGTSTITLIVGQSPTVTAVSNNSSICVGETATLTANGATTYTWNTNATTTNIAVSPTTTTTYTVIGSVAGGCSNTFTITQNVNLCSGLIQYQNLNSQIQVYPNPNNGDLNIGFDKISENIKVEIYNGLGQLLVSEKANSLIITIDLHKLYTGIYHLVISDNNQIVKREKIIKQ